MSVRRSGNVFAPLRDHPHLLPFLMLICLVMSGMGILSPVLSLYAATFSVGSTMVGMLITLFGVGRLVADFPAGALSQRFGRKKLLVAGPGIIVIGSIGAALTGDFTMLLFWRFVQGMGAGIYQTTSAAAMADMSRAGERGRIMAMYQAALLLGAGVGPAIGGWLAGQFGFQAPFWGFAVIAAVAMVVAWVTVPESVPSGSGHGHAGMGALLRNTVFMLLCVVNFTVFFTRTGAQWTMIPLMAHERFGYGTELIGLSLTLSATANFLTLPLTGWMIDRFGAGRVVVWSTMASALALTVIALAPVGAVFWLGIVMFGIGGSLNGPAVAAHAVDVVPRETYGPAVGVQRTFGDAGFLFGPLVVGLLDDLGSVGYAGGILFTGVFVLFAGTSFLLGTRAARRPPASP